MNRIENKGYLETAFTRASDVDAQIIHPVRIRAKSVGVRLYSMPVLVKYINHPSFIYSK